MEVVTIEKNTFEKIRQEFDEISAMSNDLIRKFKPKENQWLDNHDVCQTLNISKRTLQNYKDQGLLPFSRINRKSYFKRTDVEELLRNRKKNNDGTTDR